MLPADIPKTDAEYVQWAIDTLGVHFDDRINRSFRSNVALALQTVESHDFFVGLVDFLKLCANQHFNATGFQLFMEQENTSVKLLTKSYRSTVNRSFRHNVVWNRQFPTQPNNGWMTPDNWFSKLEDVVRGTIVCKYIDGPGVIAKHLEEYATGFGLWHKVNKLQKDEGYYAFHFYVRIPVELADISYNPVNINLNVEIQLTTQLQEILYQITHLHYADIRDKREDDRQAWKWDVTSNRFKAGYMSHTLHLLEAIILELRDSHVEESSTSIGEESHG